MLAKRSAIAVLTLLVFTVTTPPTHAQDPMSSVKPYDGIQAGLDAYRLAEEQRRGAVNQQLNLNDQMRFWNGYPTSRGETIYYGYMSPATAASYGYSAYGPWTGFQPWPWTGGGIWGTSAYYQPARQPIGQQQIQTGPNRWESHPVYDPPLTMLRPQPPLESPVLDGTPYATGAAVVPNPAVPPVASPPAPAFETIPPPPPVPSPPVPAAPRRGPREY